MLALPLYTTGPVGSDEVGVGRVMGAFDITAVLSRPFVGRLSDSRGRVPLMVAGAVLAGIRTAMLPFLDSLFSVVAIRLLQGVAEAAFMVASFALVADLAPPSRLGEAISYAEAVEPRQGLGRRHAQRPTYTEVSHASPAGWAAQATAAHRPSGNAREP